MARRSRPPAASTGEDGGLPALLILLSIVTGLVDAVSYLGLNRIFVANMTGNVLFLGFALAGDTNLSAWESLLALAAFATGAWTVGRLVRRVPPRRTFVGVTAVHAILVAAALVVALAADLRAGGAQAALIVLLAGGMGLQNAAVRALGVPGLTTTTVLTSTLTGLVTDPPKSMGRRRVASIAAMFIGALAGAALHLHAGLAAALVPALVLLAGIALVSW
jgi:uncharacterized membrane protein YoaK (UPF0700 family)